MFSVIKHLIKILISSIFVLDVCSYLFNQKYLYNRKVLYSFKDINLKTFTGLNPYEQVEKSDLIEKYMANHEEIDISDLKSKLSKSKLKESSTSQFEAILNLAMESETNILLLDKKKDNFEEDEIYITESELKRLWVENSYKSMGKSVDKFNLEEALLLIEDAEDEVMNNLEESDEPVVNIEDAEIFITKTELERLWLERNNTQWGLPNKNFNELDGLLLLDDDDDDDDYDEDGDEEGTKDSLEYLDSSSITLESDTEDFWAKRYDGEVSDILKNIYDTLEDKSFQRPAWKKDRHILTPDIDTQQFVGDIMQSNTFLTQRIPANWNDREKEGMSDAYLSTGTMAWPGEPETDYNVKVPIWERLNLRIGPKYDTLTGELIENKNSNNKDSKENSNEEVDWNNFDFAAEEKKDSIDIDSFFNALKSPEEGKPTGGKSTEQEDEEAEEAEAHQAQTKLSMMQASKSPKGYISQTPITQKDWKTPAKWLENPEFIESVGFEVWSKYDDQLFSDIDEKGHPIWTNDDIYTALSLKHVLGLTDLYLTDHNALTDVADDRKYWSRALEASLTGDSTRFKEPIPSYLTPDKDRGIEYSDEIIEMKGKISLEAALPDPEIDYADDSFTHNEEMQPVNKIGTIRYQYDWRNISDSSAWKIDKKIAEKIKPVIEFVNHAAELKSTKGNVLIFEYKGNIRHLIGIRSSMIQIAKECFPELVDLKLETIRAHDKFDT